jgi:hypothetical protein
MPKTKTAKNKPVDILSMEKQPIRLLYQIKYRLKKGSEGIHFGDSKTRDLTQWQYGIVESYSKAAEKAWKKNKSLIVEDAVSPQAYILDPFHFEVVAIEISWNPESEYEKFVQDEFLKAAKKNNEAKGLVGKLITMGVADGCAYYVVTGETKGKVTVEWRGFGGDRYVDHMLGMGCKVDKTMIEHLIERKINLK